MSTKHTLVSTRRFTARVPLSEYIANYRRADYFLALCAQCRNYGKRYGCPPFDIDIIQTLSGYSVIDLVGIQIIPQEQGLPLSAAEELMAPVISELSQELLAREALTAGMAFGFAGGCKLCGEQPCARTEGAPCRHPDKVRPSLEAYGFDLSKTALQLLHKPLLWGRDNTLPPYLMLIGGIVS